MFLAQRLALIALLLASAASAPAQQKQAKPSGPPTWYAQALTRGEAGLNVTHFWSKGPWLRAETVVAAHKIVTIVRGDRYYAYDGLTGSGISIRREPAAVAEDRPDRRPFAREYDGPRHVYYPAVAPEDASRSALRQLVRTFFDNSPGSAIAALLDMSSTQLSTADYKRLSALLKRGRDKGDQR